ncbi:Uncharacterised protein g2246 [Pycnogonum litorale]
MMENKRLFVGDLNTDVTEDDLRSIFKKFGHVESVELRNKSDGVDNKTFAFVNIRISPDNLASCFRAYANRTWKKCKINLQVAKESFLERLKRERNAKSRAGTKDAETESVAVPKKSSPLNVVKSKSSDTSDGDDDSIPAFQGTKFHNKARTAISGDSVEKVGNITRCTDSDGMLLRGKRGSKNETTADRAFKKESDRRRLRDAKVRRNVEISTEGISDIQKKLLTIGGSTSKSGDEADSKVTKSMPKIKLSGDKHYASNQQRVNSLNSRVSQCKSQRETIHSALASVDSKVAINKKMTFNYDSDENSDEPMSDEDKTKSTENEEIPKKDALFGSDDEDEPNAGDMFKVKPKYEGKKGQKLIELQAKFGNDDRFKMDENFLGDSDEDSNDVQGGKNCSVDGAAQRADDDDDENEINDERERNINILETVLGRQIREPAPEKIAKSYFRDTKEMRYDPNDPNCSRFEIKIERKPENKVKKKVEGEPGKLPDVSKERFYQVNESLKDTFQKVAPETNGFSFVSAFGKDSSSCSEDSECSEPEYSYEIINETDKKEKYTEWKVVNDDDKEGSKMSDDDDKRSVEMDRSVGQSTKTFFFVIDDPRLKQSSFFRKDDLQVLRDRWHEDRRKFLDMFNVRRKQVKRKSKERPERKGSKRGRFANR